MAIGLLTAGSNAADPSASTGQDVADTVNGLITGNMPVEAITLKGLPQTPGAPDGYGDLAGAVNGLIDVSGGLVTPETFGAVGDGVTDDSVALTNFFQSPLTKLMPKKARYVLKNPISVTGSFQLDGFGSTIITDGDFDTVGAITITVPIKSQQAVSAITVVNANTLPSTVAVSGFVTELTVADSSLFSLGDTVKVFSSDKTPQSPSSLNEYIGEFSTVLYIALGKVYLNGNLTRSYVTSPRVAVFDNQKSVSIKGLNFEKAATQPATSNTKCIQLFGAVAPFIQDISGINTDDDLVGLFGCFAPVCDKLTLSRSKASTGESATGYTLVEYSCAYGLHTRIFGTAVRHVYTNGAKAITDPATESPFYFGETMFTQVSDSIGFGTSNAAFDTHEGSYGVTFTDCAAYGRYTGVSSTLQPGFSNRGLNARFVNCRSFGCGFRQVATTGTLQSINSTIVACDFNATPNNLADSTVRVPMELTGLSSSIRSIADCESSAFTGFQATAISTSYATLEMRNSSIKLSRYSTTSASNFFSMTNESLISCDNLSLDSTATTSTITRIGSITDAASVLNVFGGRWRGVAAGAVSFTLNNVACTARVTDFRADNTVAAAASAGSATVVQQIRTYNQLTA